MPGACRVVSLESPSSKRARGCSAFARGVGTRLIPGQSSDNVSLRVPARDTSPHTESHTPNPGGQKEILHKGCRRRAAAAAAAVAAAKRRGRCGAHASVHGRTSRRSRSVIIVTPLRRYRGRIERTKSHERFLFRLVAARPLFRAAVSPRSELPCEPTWTLLTAMFHDSWSLLTVRSVSSVRTRLR